MEKGWYKVKFEGEWTCSFNDGDIFFPWRITDRDGNVDYFYSRRLDEIGKKITLPSYDENTKTE